jgi:hypothetical protein
MSINATQVRPAGIEMMGGVAAGCARMQANSSDVVVARPS